MLVSFARHTCISRVCECILYLSNSVTYLYCSSVHCSFWLLNHAFLSKMSAFDVRECTATINADITLKMEAAQN